MAHCSALVFTTQNIGEKMERFCFDYDLDREFSETMTIKEAKEEYEEFMNNPENFRDDLNKLLKYKKEGYKVYFKEECGNEIDEDGNIGYYSNPNGLYD